MLRPRLIPCLLLNNGGLVKTLKFSEPRYIGDPINTVRIFNEKEVDELIVLDIDATVKARDPDYRLISHLAAECRMPLCYGGGVRTVDQVERIISLGVEKVAISAAAVSTPHLVTAAAERVGRQSVVVVVDVKKTGLLGQYEVVTHNGTQRTGLDPIEFVRRMVEAGAGEIVINSVDCDGLMTGYDLDLTQLVRYSINVPMTVLGGAGSLNDVAVLYRRFGIIGAAAGSIFVFKGRLRAVLVNYPDRLVRTSLVD